MSNSHSAGCSRRQWCAAAGATLLVASVGCESSPGQTDDGGTDLASSGRDLAQQGSSSCAGSINAGLASAVTAASPKLVSDVLVCRDANGLYAMTALCPHAGCTVRHQTSGFFCPCHGATFDLNGQHPTSPAQQALDHYALCVDANGNAVIDANTIVSPSTRA